ncbi:hypothetical protein [Bradyrhizobium sp.]|uniref:hypothetical protein n=1 Tax=Bradyrhizobium sp. TaxID=376 RepID=UPI0025BC3106|nr:hypothetical protein [Bradyrhizobium sp.]
MADQKRRERSEIVAERQRQAAALASLQIEKARIDAQRRHAEADVGPVRYLAELIGTQATHLERPVRRLTLTTCRERFRTLAAEYVATSLKRPESEALRIGRTERCSAIIATQYAKNDPTLIQTWSAALPSS